jgi:hypothetical protein
VVIDCFLFGGELDILEGRLHTLNDSVDHFVIVELSHQFQNQYKGFILADNFDRFKKFHHKMTYKMIESRQSSDPWQNEIQQRREIESILNNMNLSDDDIITVCDVDEWWNPDQFPDPDHDVVAFNMKKYNMSLHWFHKYELTGVGGKWKYFKGKNLDHERRQLRHTFHAITGGTHLTTMGSLDNALKKMSGYAHSEFNDGTLEEKTRDSWEKGYFYGEVFEEVDFDEDTPDWIKDYRFPLEWYRKRS